MPSTILFLANFDFDLKLNMTVGPGFRKPCFAMHEQSGRNAAGECLPPRADIQSEFVTTQSREIKFRIPHIFFLQSIMSVCMITRHTGSYYL